MQRHPYSLLEATGRSLGQTSCSMSLQGGSVVIRVEEDLLLLKSTSGDFSNGLMEGFGLVKIIPVAGSEHVCVLVLLIHPVSAVPKLTVTLIS